MYDEIKALVTQMAKEVSDRDLSEMEVKVEEDKRHSTLDVKQTFSIRVVNG